MNRQFNFKTTALGVILSLALIAPAWAQAQKPEQPAQPQAQTPAHPQAQMPVPDVEKAKGPEQAQAVGQKAMGDQFKQRRIAMIKSLKLPPEKEKAVLAVEDKYTQQRKATIDNLKKAHADLEALSKAPQIDETKAKELVGMVTSGMDAIFNSFKSQRDEELALMTPAEQVKYIVAMAKFRDEMMGKKEAKKPETKKEGKKKK